MHLELRTLHALRYGLLAVAALASIVAGCETKTPTAPDAVKVPAGTSPTTVLPPGPTAFAISPPAPRPNQPVAFNGTGSPAAAGKTIVAYAWDFGDGTMGSGPTTSHTYTAEGIYNVTLTMTDSDAGKITLSQPVSILPLVPTTTTTGLPTFRSVRYVNPQAPATVPSDLTLVFELLPSARSSLVARSPLAVLVPHAVETYQVRGVYQTRDGANTGEIEGQMVGTITPAVVGSFTGSLSTVFQGCAARRRFAGQIDQLLMWTGGETLDMCSPTPWTYPSLTMQASQGPPPTTTSIVTTTTIPAAPGTLAGTVTDSRGPIVGATVTAFNGAGGSQGALTGTGGSYAIPGLAPGSWSVQVTHPEHVPQQNVINIVSGSTTTYSPVLASLTGTPGSLTGFVTTPPVEGPAVPVFGATVTAFNAVGASQGVLTADNGSYSIAGLAPGAWSVLVSHPDYFPRQDSVAIVPGGTTTHSVTLIRRPGPTTTTISTTTIPTTTIPTTTIPTTTIPTTTIPTTTIPTTTIPTTTIPTTTIITSIPSTIPSTTTTSIIVINTPAGLRR